MFEKTIDYARESLIAASEAAVDRAGDRDVQPGVHRRILFKRPSIDQTHLCISDPAGLDPNGLDVWRLYTSQRLNLEQMNVNLLR